MPLGSDKKKSQLDLTRLDFQIFILVSIILHYKYSKEKV